jgi:hypothetical protein
LDVNNFYGPTTDAASCDKEDHQAWIWNNDGVVRSKHNGQCLTAGAELEVWAGPLSDGSQAVVLLNRANSGSEPITVHWTDLGFPADHPALVRDLWARKDVGTFTGNYTTPVINHHSVMMLKVALTK